MTSAVLLLLDGDQSPEPVVVSGLLRTVPGSRNGGAALVGIEDPPRGNYNSCRRNNRRTACPAPDHWPMKRRSETRWNVECPTPTSGGQLWYVAYREVGLSTRQQ